jgi:hypothetical protein
MEPARPPGTPQVSEIEIVLVEQTSRSLTPSVAGWPPLPNDYPAKQTH